MKYVRGTHRSSAEDAQLAPSALIERGEGLDGGDGEGTVDLDIGVLAVSGPFRVGGTIRNVREPEFGGMQLPRQIRIGGAFDAGLAGLVPVTIALDADLRRYNSGTGDRRVVALGGERWWLERRLGIRAGARFNTVGARERAGTLGASIALRSALYVDAHVAAGGGADDGGWGLGIRVSF